MGRYRYLPLLLSVGGCLLLAATVATAHPRASGGDGPAGGSWRSVTVDENDSDERDYFGYDAAIAGNQSGKVSYEGAQLLNVLLLNNNERAIVWKWKEEKKIQTWGGNKTNIDVLVYPEHVPEVVRVMRDAGIKFEVTIPDLGRAIQLENPPPDEDEDEFQHRKGHRMTWSAYHRLADIHDYLNFLGQAYPNLVKTKTIGTSVLGQNLLIVKISNGQQGNRAIWVDGGMHAREWISPASVTYMINEIVENYDSLPDYLRNMDLYFLPVANPDGYEYSHTTDRLWRKNRSRESKQCAGTDLNRNFGYRWGGKGSSKNPCTENYGGTGAFTEPETAAIQKFILSSGARFVGSISYHSYGQYILYPWGYDRVVPPDYQDLQAVGLKAAKSQLKETKTLLEKNEMNVSRQTLNAKQDLESATEQLKDTREQNTALQLQLDNLTKAHQELRFAYDDLLNVRRSLELRITETDADLKRCKNDLASAKEGNVKLSESEANLKRLLEIERLQSKTARLQSEKDAKCIQDLNRQVKEMERIIQRKHPDSVSALIVASKTESETNLMSARNLLENRIKQLESEAAVREVQSTKVFSEVQDKFNAMKAKYESHIEDLETHVNDLKGQLKSKSDTYDIYTQTYSDPEGRRVDKDTTSAGTQTQTQAQAPIRPTKKPDARTPADREQKEETHLLATIRGMQTDLTNKEKALAKLQKEIDELRKTNRRLQKERESNLKGDGRGAKDGGGGGGGGKFEKANGIAHTPTDNLESELVMMREERDKIKTQLCRLEEDFQSLKTKRIQDLNILQEAHEREITMYMGNIAPMREQLDIQQVSIGTLQGQLASAKEELAIITVERDHLEAKLKNFQRMEAECPDADNDYQVSLQKKIAYLERRYEEREHRLRAIVHGLAQKQVMARDCAQCAARQQQLIGYKAELDQLLATLRYLQ